MSSKSKSLFTGETITCVKGSNLLFKNLQFALNASDTLVVTGPNGSGKSSLLRIMAGLSRPADGIIRWDSANIANDTYAHSRRLNYLGHSNGTKSMLSAGQDLNFWSKIRDQRGSDKTNSILEYFNLFSKRNLPIQFLSSGQKRRVALARLVIHPASLWLLDEPTNGLDADGLSIFESMVLEFRNTGGIVVIATHETLNLAGSVIKIDLRDYFIERKQKANTLNEFPLDIE